MYLSINTHFCKLIPAISRILVNLEYYEASSNEFKGFEFVKKQNALSLAIISMIINSVKNKLNAFFGKRRPKWRILFNYNKTIFKKQEYFFVKK